ncbi:MAG: FG-GAP repeat protein [Proteobacteria bacterium]|nr:FG-GAP repeat protein [Pseudomonadota bacterium]
MALTGIEDMDYSGFAVSSLGDFNGDGFADLATVSSLADRAGVDDVGAAYLMFGSNSRFQRHRRARILERQ